MADPKTSNRERLLRLIDGGTEALKEFHEENAPAPVQKVQRPEPVRVPASAWKPKIRISRGDALQIGKWLLMAAVFSATLHYGLEIARTLKARPAVPVTETGMPAAIDETGGTGLRMVGVDLSEPAVALLEDVRTGKTHFARVNDHVSGVRVKKIEKNRVTVSYLGKTLELQ